MDAFENVTSLVDKGVYSQHNVRDWSGHNREDTVGASEVSQCARKTTYLKHGQPIDPSYRQDYGALERGHNVESWVVAQLRAALKDHPQGLRLAFAGDDQETLVIGAQSATPDGLFIAPEPCMVVPLRYDAMGRVVEDAIVDQLYLEVKSIDPRAFDGLKEPKIEHVSQAIQGMDIVRRAGLYAPMFAVILYVNASFYSERKAYYVQYDQDYAARLTQRANAIMYTYGLNSLPRAEGKYINEGTECQYCPFKKACTIQEVGAIPKDKKETTPEIEAKIIPLIEQYAQANDGKKFAEHETGRIAEDVKEILQQAGTKSVRTKAGSVSYYSSKTPTRVSQDKMIAAGLDPTPFLEGGELYPRLTITPKRGNQQTEEVD